MNSFQTLVDVNSVPDLALAPLANLIAQIQNNVVRFVIGAIGIALVAIILLLSFPGFPLTTMITSSPLWIKYGKGIPAGVWILLGYLANMLFSRFPGVEGTDLPNYVMFLLGAAILVSTWMSPCKRYIAMAVAIYIMFIALIKMGFVGGRSIAPDSLLYMLIQWHGAVVLVAILSEYIFFNFQTCQFKKN